MLHLHRSLTLAASLLISAPLAAPALADAPASRPAATRPAAAVAVDFLQGKAAADAIVDDRAEPFFATLTPHEMSAKTGKPITGATPEAQRQECVRRFRAGVRDFTDAERDALRAAVADARRVLLRVAPKAAAGPWRFIKVSDEIEGGLPHTRGDCIVLSEQVLAQLSELRKRSPDAARLVLGQLVVHEGSHVLQRANPALFAKLYTDVWGFERAKSIASNDWLLARQLTNPDGVVYDWVFPVGDGADRRWYLPMLIANKPEPTKQTPADMALVIVELEPTGPGTYRPKPGKDGAPAVQPIQTAKAYLDVVGRHGDTYHPNEVAAHLMENVFVLEATGPEGFVKAPGLPRAREPDAPTKRFRAWAAENLR